jgi:bacterioferritin-associated ferredoxin
MPLTWRNEADSKSGNLPTTFVSHQWPGSEMIVCSCNVLTDHEVRGAANASAPRTTGQVFGCLGCSAQCGRCARTIRAIMDEAFVAAMRGRPAACAACKT